MEQPDISELYAHKGFSYAIGNDSNHPRPDILAMTAMVDGRIAGIAGASDDCEMMWQVGIDVLPEYRNRGIAAVLTNKLAIEILKRGKIPNYAAATSNVASQRVARRAGYVLAWTGVYRGRFDGELTGPTS